ncbi:MAG: flavin-nucleotide-binding protein [Hyphomicrobiales bacterium]|nr:MAG: flavin-nucleotide-binding protein [Hyphomicrobiales bacterium]
MTIIDTIEQLEAIYGTPSGASLVKEVAHLTPEYQKYIEAAPFCALATSGPEGLDCTPRGDFPGFVRVADEGTLLMPDRRGNNRVDSLRNIVHEPKVGLLFLIPGSKNCLRVNGLAHLSTAPDLKASFAVNEKEPRSIIVIKTQAIYFQCGRAIMRARLWEQDAQTGAQDLPSPGDIMSAITNQEFDGKKYDKEWGGRAEKTMW